MYLAMGGDIIGFSGSRGVDVVSISSIPGPGLPRLILAGAGLLAWWQRRQKIA
jgi:hypothetical protein